MEAADEPDYCTFIQPGRRPKAGWLNLIEAQFGARKRFTADNTNDGDHLQRQKRVRAYLN